MVVAAADSGKVDTYQRCPVARQIAHEHVVKFGKIVIRREVLCITDECDMLAICAPNRRKRSTGSSSANVPRQRRNRRKPGGTAGAASAARLQIPITRQDRMRIITKCVQRQEITRRVVPITRIQKSSIRAEGKIASDANGVCIAGTNQNFRRGKFVRKPCELVPNIVGCQDPSNATLAGIKQVGVLVIVIGGPELVSASDVTKIGHANELLRTRRNSLLTRAKRQTQKREQRHCGGKNEQFDSRKCDGGAVFQGSPERFALRLVNVDGARAWRIHGRLWSITRTPPKSQS